MAEIINLRRARKQAARAADKVAAAESRLRHGTTRAVRTTADAAQRIADKQLDGHRLSRSEQRPDASEE